MGKEQVGPQKAEAVSQLCGLLFLQLQGGPRREGKFDECCFCKKPLILFRQKLLVNSVTGLGDVEYDH
jgi:hypothetical protein